MTSERAYVSRGGLKLAAALDAFGVDPAGQRCADFGANVGGFTDCLLRRGAAKVYAVDTGYGDLAWTLRNDPRVVVLERTNVLHAPCPAPADLVVIDLAWTPQVRGVPAAAGWLGPGGRIVSLLKPLYELSKLGRKRGRKRLDPGESRVVCREVCMRLADAGFVPRAVMPSPVRGKGGNEEFLLLLEPGETFAGP